MEKLNDRELRALLSELTPEEYRKIAAARMKAYFSLTRMMRFSFVRIFLLMISIPFESCSRNLLLSPARIASW